VVPASSTGTHSFVVTAVDHAQHDPVTVENSYHVLVFSSLSIQLHPENVHEQPILQH